jgi:hypothetical protein
MTKEEKIKMMIKRLKNTEARKKLTQLLEKNLLENGTGNFSYTDFQVEILQSMIES